MALCIAHAQSGRISTSGLKSDVTIVFLDTDFIHVGAHRLRHTQDFRLTLTECSLGRLADSLFH